MRIYKIEKPVKTKTKRATEGRKPAVEMSADEVTWKSLLRTGLCMGMDSPCVSGKCDVMCAYGRRYLREKDKHAG